MCIIDSILFNSVFGRHPVGDGQPVTKATERLMGPGFADLNARTAASQRIMDAMPRETLSVTSADGLRLEGYLFRSTTPCDKTAVCIHGYNSTGFVDFATVGLEYLRRGFNLLLPTSRACGASEGDITTFGALESRDTLLWLHKLDELFPGGETVLQGCSLGGAAVCMAANGELPENVRAIVSDCAFATMRGEFTHMLKFIAHLPPWPAMNMLERRFRRRVGVGFDEPSPLASVAGAGTPMFFVHGREDRYIPCADAERLYNACPADKELLIVDGAGHAAAHLRGGDGYYEAIFAFIGRHMTLPPVSAGR